MENIKMNTSAPEMAGGAGKSSEAISAAKEVGGTGKINEITSAQGTGNVMMYKLPKAQVPALLAAIAQVQDLIVPIKKAGQVNFGLWSEDAEVDLETLKSVKSPKDAFFPQSETLYSCYRDGKKLSIQPEELKKQPFVLFGVKGCDVKGIEVLDRVFLAEPVDTFYRARRATGTIVAMACHEPEETCFCKVFGVDCAEPKADVAVWMTEESFYWKPMTEKGAKLTEQVQGTLESQCQEKMKVEAGEGQPQEENKVEAGEGQPREDMKAESGEVQAQEENKAEAGEGQPREENKAEAGEGQPQEENKVEAGEGQPREENKAEAGEGQPQEDMKAESGDVQKQKEMKAAAGTLAWETADESELDTEKANIRAIVEQLPYTNLSLEGWDGNATEEKFNAPQWEDLYKPCLACGTCTFVCPTCQCYDIKDYDTGHGVKRYRCWDSCMYSDFTMMAHGNNRTSQLQRFRQRFMHKLVYFPANNDGMYSCVGCGRCVSKCPSGLNIVKVIKKFQKPGNGENAGGDKA